MGVFGKYPAEYNPKVHGPYCLSRFYGKPDTPFGDVKLGQMGSWLARRNWSYSAMWGAVHRGYWRWAVKNLHVRSSGFAPFGQIGMIMSGVYFVLLYKTRSAHRHCKYH